jgi:hypothetical protein
MNDHIEKANRMFEAPRPAPIISTYQQEQNAIHANHQRLKAARIEREATAKQSTP